MSILPIHVPLLLALLGGAPHPSAPAPAARQTCFYEPSGTVYMASGDVLPFYPETNSVGGCTGVTLGILPADGTAGFKTTAGGCGTTTITGGGPFRVRGCASGTVTLTVSYGGTVLQTIDIVVD
jgi:hypothetical protein